MKTNPFHTSIIESNLSKTNGTRYYRFDSFDNEYLQTKKRLKTWNTALWIALALLIIISELVDFGITVYSFILRGIIYGFIEIKTKSVMNEINRTDKTVDLLEDEKRREELSIVGNDDILYKYYAEQIGDINSQEAQKYKEKHDIWGTYRKKK